MRVLSCASFEVIPCALKYIKESSGLCTLLAMFSSGLYTLFTMFSCSHCSAYTYNM